MGLTNRGNNNPAKLSILVYPASLHLLYLERKQKIKIHYANNAMHIAINCYLQPTIQANYFEH